MIMEQNKGKKKKKGKIKVGEPIVIFCNWCQLIGTGFLNVERDN